MSTESAHLRRQTIKILGYEKSNNEGKMQTKQNHRMIEKRQTESECETRLKKLKTNQMTEKQRKRKCSDEKAAYLLKLNLFVIHIVFKVYLGIIQ